MRPAPLGKPQIDVKMLPSDPITELCARVEEALKDVPFPLPVSVDELVSTEYLWRQEVYWTCGLVIEYWRGIQLLLKEGLYRPATALSRSMHECKIRFDYLVDNEDELRDWFEWQWSRDYHRFNDELRYDHMLSSESARRLRQDLDAIESLLGKVPSRRKHPWKSPREMLEHRYRTAELGEVRRDYRWFVADLSQYVHISSSYVPSALLTALLTEISVITTLGTAMRLCKEKLFIDPPAGELAVLCERTLVDMQQDLRSRIETFERGSTLATE